MNKQKLHRDKALAFLFMTLMFTVIVFSFAQQQSNDDAITFLRANPLYLIILIMPLCFWFFFLVKGNTKQNLLAFIKKDFLNYVAKYISVIMVSYLVYFILIPHQTKDFFDSLIGLFLFILVFVLFLLARWFEEIKLPELTRKSVKELGKAILWPILFIFTISTISYSIHYYLLSFNKEASILLTGIYLFGILSFLLPTIFKKKVPKIIFSFIMFCLLLFVALWAVKLFLPHLNFATRVIYLGVMFLIFIILLIIQNKCINKSWFKSFLKKLGDESEDLIPKDSQTSASSP